MKPGPLLAALGTAAYTGRQVTSLYKSAAYLKNKLAPRRTYKKKMRYGRSRRTVRSGAYNTGPRYRRVMPIQRAPSLQFKTDNINRTLTTPQTLSITDVSAGDSTFQRDGRNIRIMNVRGQVRMPQGDNVRMVVYQPLENNDTLLLASTHDPIDPNNYKVLYDRYWHSDNSAGNRIQRYNINFGKYGHRIAYNGTAATDNTTPKIYIYFHASAGTGNAIGHNICSFVDE